MWIKDMYKNYFKYLPTYLWNIYVDSLYIWKKEIAKEFFEFLFNNKEFYEKTISIFSMIDNSWYEKQINEIKEKFFEYMSNKFKKIWYSDNDIKELLKDYKKYIWELFNDELLKDTNPSDIDKSSKFYIPFTITWFIEYVASNFVPIWNYKAKWVFPIVEFFDYVNFWNLIYKRWQDEVKEYVLFNSKVFTPMFLYWLIQSKKLEHEYSVLDIEWILELSNMNYV